MERKVWLVIGFLLALSSSFQLDRYSPEDGGVFYAHLTIFSVAIIMNMVNVLAVLRGKLEKHEKRQSNEREQNDAS